MREINSASMNAVTGALARLPRPVSVPDGRGFSRVRVEATIPTKNATAGAIDFTGARAKAAVACIFDNQTLRFGDRVADIVDNALGYNRAREQCIALSLDDFVIVHPTSGVALRISEIGDADVLKAAVAAGATFNLVAEYVRPFEVVILGEDAYAYCPGATQMRQMQHEFIRGGSFGPDANFVQDGAASLLWVFDDFEASDDKWAAVARLYQQEEAGRESHGPKGEIGLLSMWEYTGAGAATALTLFSIVREGDASIHETVRASRVVRDAKYTLPLGAYDLNTLATVLHSLPAGSERQDIPTGEAWKFLQPSAELNPAKTAWLYVPARSEAEQDAMVGTNVETTRGVKLISAAAKTGKSLTANVAALEPVILAREGGGDFEALPGRVYAVGLQPTTHLPTVVAQAAQAAAASGDAETRPAQAGKVATAIGKYLPGASSARRGRKSSVVRSLAARFAR